MEALRVRPAALRVMRAALAVRRAALRVMPAALGAMLAALGVRPAASGVMLAALGVRRARSASQSDSRRGATAGQAHLASLGRGNGRRAEGR